MNSLEEAYSLLAKIKKRRLDRAKRFGINENKKIIKNVRYWLFHKKWQSSTKYCPQCGNTYLGEMPSLKLKVCQDCVPNVWIKIKK